MAYVDSEAPLKFPFLFGGTFIEGRAVDEEVRRFREFPFLFGGTFIEGRNQEQRVRTCKEISLPFRRDFH